MPSLQERLRRLRADTGITPAPASADVDAAPLESRELPPPTLAERIRRLSPGRADSRVHHQEPDPEALAEGLGAEITAPGVLRLQRERPLRQRHGRIEPGCSVEALLELMHAGRDRPPQDPAGWTFLDTETSGLAGGTGTWAFVCGIARIRDDRLIIRQYLLTRLDAEPDFIGQVAAELAAANLLISYNGKTFDLPLLSTRLQLAAPDRLRDALPADRPHLDLLHTVRRAYAGRWPDCRLATCEQRLLGLHRAGDLPGAEAPAAWLDWLRHGDGRRLGPVLRHNRTDLISLAALIPALVAVQQDPLRHGADTAAVARHLLRGGRADQARSLLQRAGSDLNADGALILAALHRRHGDWSASVAIWQCLADRHNPIAIEQLAKYHEHIVGDVQLALDYAQRLPPTPDRDHPCRRLKAKLVRASGDLLDKSA
jgi:uncharacterized protein YprB with RNaseH-like and TPR domain